MVPALGIDDDQSCESIVSVRMLGDLLQTVAAVAGTEHLPVLDWDSCSEALRYIGSVYELTISCYRCG